jgi:hypothetical protein
MPGRVGWSAGGQVDSGGRGKGAVEVVVRARARRGAGWSAAASFVLACCALLGVGSTGVAWLQPAQRRDGGPRFGSGERLVG